MVFKPAATSGTVPDAGLAALNEPLEATLDRWRRESGELAQSGAYAWLASRVGSSRVLEIGCGFGASTMALEQAGKTVFALDNRMDCLEATQRLVPQGTFGMADIQHYDERLLDDLKAFEPSAIVCWLAGAPADALPRDVPASYAVMQHRLVMQHAVVNLAACLPSVLSVHLADRTAFPWKMKDAARLTMVKMLHGSVLKGMPFTLSDADVQFRKLEFSHPHTPIRALAGVLPVIGEATIKRQA